VIDVNLAVGSVDVLNEDISIPFLLLVDAAAEVEVVQMAGRLKGLALGVLRCLGRVCELIDEEVLEARRHYIFRYMFALL